MGKKTQAILEDPDAESKFPFSIATINTLLVLRCIRGVIPVVLTAVLLLLLIFTLILYVDKVDLERHLEKALTREQAMDRQLTLTRALTDNIHIELGKTSANKELKEKEVERIQGERASIEAKYKVILKEITSLEDQLTACEGGGETAMVT